MYERGKMSNKQKEMQDILKNIKCEDETEKVCVNCKKEYTPNEENPNHKSFKYCTSKCQNIYGMKSDVIGYLKSIGIPKRYLECDLKNMSKDFSFLFTKDTFGNIYISGENPGTGKTYLATSILKEYGLRFGKKCYFVNSTRLMFQIKNTFNNSSENEIDIINKYCSYDLLVIDDLGAERISDYTISVFYLILTDRYEKMLPTIITTNYTPDELIEKYNRRIVSRSMSGEKFRLDGDDKRLIN